MEEDWTNIMIVHVDNICVGSWENQENQPSFLLPQILFVSSKKDFYRRGKLNQFKYHQMSPFLPGISNCT